MTRLQSLRNRKEVLILANRKHHYTQSRHPKTDKYYKVLLSIRKEINTIECVNIRPLRAKVGMTVKDLYNLNKKQIKMERVISMRCTPEQFESIKDRIPYPILHIDDFEGCPNLINNYDFKDKIVSNTWRIREEHHETFNADIFLEACGVEVEKVWKGSEMQFKNLDGEWIDCASNLTREYRLKPQSDYSKEIEALQLKAKENGMTVTINFEKL